MPLLQWILLATFLGDLSDLQLYLHGWDVKYMSVLLAKVAEIVKLGELRVKDE